VDLHRTVLDEYFSRCYRRGRGDVVVLDHHVIFWYLSNKRLLVYVEYARVSVELGLLLRLDGHGGIDHITRLTFIDVTELIFELKVVIRLLFSRNNHLEVDPHLLLIFGHALAFRVDASTG
jgi:hypothetical protein